MSSGTTNPPKPSINHVPVATTVGLGLNPSGGSGKNNSGNNGRPVFLGQQSDPGDLAPSKRRVRLLDPGSGVGANRGASNPRKRTGRPNRPPYSTFPSTDSYHGNASDILRSRGDSSVIDPKYDDGSDETTPLNRSNSSGPSRTLTPTFGDRTEVSSKDVKVINDLIDDLSKLEPAPTDRLPLRGLPEASGMGLRTGVVDDIATTTFNLQCEPQIPSHSGSFSHGSAGKHRHNSLLSSSSGRNGSLTLETPGITEQVKNFKGYTFGSLNLYLDLTPSFTPLYPI